LNVEGEEVRKRLRGREGAMCSRELGGYMRRLTTPSRRATGGNR